jgi:hypothetical protein
MGANAAEERPVLIVNPETHDSDYEAREISPAARQLLLSAWGCEELLPDEKRKIDDSVVNLFIYAASMEEQLLVQIQCERQCVKFDDSSSAAVRSCLENIRENSSFVLGVPISEIPEIARLGAVERILAA